MGWKPNPTQPIKLNGAFFTLCAILRFVVASAAEAELGALFLNCKQGTIFWLTLEEMGHPQPLTLVNWTILPQWALQITHWHVNAQDQWKWDFSGLLMQSKSGSWHPILSRERKPWWLPKQTPSWRTPYSSLPLLLAWKDVTSRTAKSQQAYHSEKVCWNHPRWVPTDKLTTRNSH